MSRSIHDGILNGFKEKPYNKSWEAWLEGIRFMPQHLRTPVFADCSGSALLLALTQVPASSDTKQELAQLLWKSVCRLLKNLTLDLLCDPAKWILVKPYVSKSTPWTFAHPC